MNSCTGRFLLSW